MAGIMVSASTGVTNSLLDKLTALLGEEYKLHKDVKRNINSLKYELSSMSALLEKLADMEVLDPQTKEWRNQVREMAYDIEDCIDNYMYRLKHKSDDTEKLGFFPTLFRKIKEMIKELGTRHEIAEQIQELKDQIIEVNQRRKRYKLDATINNSASGSNVVHIDPRVAMLYAEAKSLVGIDGPREEIMKWVMDAEQQLKVVFIVGLGGLGKTTLANQVYQNIGADFECQAFVSVSQKPDMKKILRAILSQVNQGYHCPEEWDEAQLIRLLREFLENKRYFIVIDDVWRDEAWEIINCAFPNNKYGSRIVITTRIRTIAKPCSPLQNLVYNLKPLNEVDSESLFFGRIFGSKDGCPSHLKEISTEIMKKCGGLPLAIITMSGLLSTRSLAKEEWESVRNSVGSGLEKNYDVKKMNMILSLSYNDLPHHLKTCLLYLSIFPEDYEIYRARLLRRWIAEGFIEIVRGRTIVEEAECYFNELINRSMIQPINFNHYGQVDECRVHDMIRDLIISCAIEENFVTFIDDKEHNFISNDKVRRLSLDYHDKNCVIVSSMDISHVRSLSVFGGYSEQMSPLGDFQALRVVDLESIDGLENHHIKNIGELVQLRYIRLNTKKITELPKQIGKLQFLETLDVEGTSIDELPASIIELQRLKHLLVDGVTLPAGIGNVRVLEELSGIYVDDGCSMTCFQELCSLTKLRVLHLNLLTKYFLSGSDDDKRRYPENWALYLSKLGCSNLRDLFLTSDHEISLDSWSPPSHILRRLILREGCFVSKIPEWISSLTNLTDLQIEVETLGQECFQILGDLPALAELWLASIDSEVALEEKLIVISSGGFPSLRAIMLMSFVVVMMFEAGAMPKLEHLNLSMVKAHGAQSLCGNALDLGVHHLSALKVLVVYIDCRDAWVEEVEALEATISNAASLLPNHLTLVLRRKYEGKIKMVKDGEYDHEDGEEKFIAAAS